MNTLKSQLTPSRIVVPFIIENRNAATTLRESWGWGDILGSGFPIEDFTLIVERCYFWFTPGSHSGGCTLTTNCDIFKDSTSNKVFDTLTYDSTATDDDTILRIDADTGDYANGEAGATFSGGDTLLARMQIQTDTSTARVLNPKGILVCRSLGS